MKDIFYFLLSFLITLFVITALTFGITEKKYYELPESQIGLVIHKKERPIFGQEVYVLHADSTIGVFNCYDILYDQIEVGDSIKNGNIQRQSN